MLARLITFVYVTVSLVVAGGTALYVLLRDVSPALLIPGLLGGAGLAVVGSGLVALLTERVKIRGGWLEREASPLFYWLLVLGGHFGVGGMLLKFSWDMFQIAGDFLGG